MNVLLVFRDLFRILNFKRNVHESKCPIYFETQNTSFCSSNALSHNSPITRSIKLNLVKGGKEMYGTV
jgi:hypothetical protein